LVGQSCEKPTAGESAINPVAAIAKRCSRFMLISIRRGRAVPDSRYSASFEIL